jgi:hypothetical protein
MSHRSSIRFLQLKSALPAGKETKLRRRNGDIEQVLDAHRAVTTAVEAAPFTFPAYTNNCKATVASANAKTVARK